jgi:hypothetical protein
VDETFHPFQTTPFGLAIPLIEAHLRFRNSVTLAPGIITPSVALARIFDLDGALTRSTIHDSLVLVALSFPHVVCMRFSLALLDLVQICFRCPVAIFFGMEILVKHSTFESTAPSSTLGDGASISVNVPPAER